MCHWYDVVNLETVIWQRLEPQNRDVSMHKDAAGMVTSMIEPSGKHVYNTSLDLHFFHCHAYRRPPKLECICTVTQHGIHHKRHEGT